MRGARSTCLVVTFTCNHAATSQRTRVSSRDLRFFVLVAVGATPIGSQSPTAYARTPASGSASSSVPLGAWAAIYFVQHDSASGRSRTLLTDGPRVTSRPKSTGLARRSNSRPAGGACAPQSDFVPCRSKGGEAKMRRTAAVLALVIASLGLGLAHSTAEPSRRDL